MTKINRSSIINNATQELFIQQATAQTPALAEDKVRLVYPINAKYTDIMRSTSRSATAAATVYAVNADKPFYLTYIQLSYRCDAACDTTEISVSASVDGLTRTVCRFVRPGAGVADKDTMYISFPFPVKVTPGTNIQHASTFTAGTITYTTTIGGFIIE